MGGPCDFLVPAAILYDNPQGLTKAQFAAEMDKIGGKTKSKYRLSFSRLHHAGIWGVARVLKLPKTQEYEEREKANWEPNLRYFKESEYLHFKSSPKDKKSFEIRRTSRKIIGEATIKIAGSYREHKKGDYVHAYPIESNPEEYLQKRDLEFKVTKVLQTEHNHLKGLEITDEEFLEEKDIDQELEVEVIEEEKQTEIFRTFSAFVSKYPEYSPERMFDFSQKEGMVFIDYERVRGEKDGAFKWIRKGNKYFLDIDFMIENLSPNSVLAQQGWRHETKNHGNFSLTDLVLTLQAIENKNWEVLKNKATADRLKEVPEFIYSNPETLKAYEKAVLQTEISQMAIKNNWAHTEFLHHYMEMSSQINRLSFKEKRRAFLQQKRIEKEEERRRQEETAKWFEDQKNKVPF